MIDYKPLKTRKIYNDATKWLSDSFSLMYQKPMEVLDDFLNNRDLPAGYGTLSGACFSLAAWFEEAYIVASFEGNESAVTNLTQSLSYDLANIFIQDKTRDFYPERRFMDYSFRRHGLVLAKTVAVGNFAEFERLGMLILKNLRNNRYAGLSSTKVAWFIFNLFHFWSLNKPFNNDSVLFLPGFYRILLNKWDSDLSDEYKICFREACEYHVQESNYDTVKRYYDFNDHFYRVYPAELLAIIQMRKKIKIKALDFKHSLLDLPTAIIVDEFEKQQRDLPEKIMKKVFDELT